MGVLGRIRQSLSRTTQQIVDRFDDLVRLADAPERRSRPLDVDTLEALEEILITADVGVAASERIVRAVRQRTPHGAGLRDLVKQEIRAIFAAAETPVIVEHPPKVTLIVGVNGTGKTTTVGKLANLLRAEGKRPLICAADTFRAAAVEQLEIWAARAGVDMVRARDGADPAAVVFDAISSGKAKGRDPILIDTAGRLHTRVNLMNELEKIRRVASREVAGAPQETLLVLDATVGQNGVTQAREFMGVAGVNGIVLTKLDGTAKGGVAVAIAHDLKLPIRYVGIWRRHRRSRAIFGRRIRGRALRGEVVGNATTKTRRHEKELDALRVFAPSWPKALKISRAFGLGNVTHTEYMERALFLAERGRGRTSPNPMVGAVIVSTAGVVVGQGFHERAGEPHAEVRALNLAGDARPRRHAVLHARTVLSRRPHRAVRAPDCRGRHRTGRGLDGGSQSGRAGPGILLICARMASASKLVPVASESTRLNQPFLTLMRDHRPFVILKAATSIDGYVAEAPATRTRLTSAAGQPSRARVPCRGGRDRRRRRDRARRRSAADGAGDLSGAAADAGGVRSAVAHARDTRDCSRHSRPGLSSSSPRRRRREPTSDDRSKREARTSRSPQTTRFGPRSSGWARARSGRCCSKAARPCMRRRGTSGSSISCGST